MGTNTDPYQKAEARYHLTRGLIEVLADARNPFSILTKSTLVLRDLDVLRAARNRAEVGLSISIGTLDTDVWRLLEPGTPPPRGRLEAVRKLNAAGIPCGVLITPVVPGLSDDDEHLEETARLQGRRRDISSHDRAPPTTEGSRALSRLPRRPAAGSPQALPAAVFGRFLSTGGGTKPHRGNRRARIRRCVPTRQLRSSTPDPPNTRLMRSRSCNSGERGRERSDERRATSPSERRPAPAPQVGAGYAPLSRVSLIALSPADISSPILAAWSSGRTSVIHTKLH